MDDMALVCTNKRHLKRAVQFIRENMFGMGMELKKWQWFKITGTHPLTFLSYRFFHKRTILTKKLMVRISRRMKKASECMNAHTAAGVISLMGVLKHCDSFNFKQKYVYPFVNIQVCKRLISCKSKQQAFLRLQKEMLAT